MTVEMTDFYPQITVTSVPQNSPATPVQLSMEARRQQVISLILQRMTPGKIAEKLGVDRKTVYTDFMEWAKSEQATYLQIEWMQQYENMKQEDPQTAFEALTKLMMKLLEKQAKIELNLTSETNILVKTNIAYSEEDKNAILSARRAILNRRSSPPEPISIH